jgi:hypothetical protein
VSIKYKELFGIEFVVYNYGSYFEKTERILLIDVEIISEFVNLGINCSFIFETLPNLLI